MSNKLRSRKKVGQAKPEITKPEIKVVLPLGNRYTKEVALQVATMIGEGLTACYPKAKVIVGKGEEGDLKLYVSKSLNSAEVYAQLMKLLTLGISILGGELEEAGRENQVKILISTAK